ncbi:MAG: hypothetical protein EBE86_009670 [Hormoscilla sp. GUM202]|nr:hypothetical protein [Hormoscilla sp. GM7CHS1pb]MBO1347635.1 hypothetical protein [Hormoscilla sp. GUM202]
MRYRPKFGRGAGLTLEEFQRLYQAEQMDINVAYRYRNARWLILYGTITGATTDSTYEFFRQVLNYDLADFFQRHSSRFRQEMESVLQTLLQ